MVLLACAFAFPMPAGAEEPGDPPEAGSSMLAPLAPLNNEIARRAEIRRLLAPQGASYLPAPKRERRVMSNEELLRLREDIRANRDVYEVRDGGGRGRR